MSISIVLVDDQKLVREGIRALLALNEQMRVLSEADDGIQALDMVQKHKPDILLLDIRMPNLNGVEVLRQLQSFANPPAVLVLTTFDDHDLVLECIKLGAKGYLRKDVSFDDLISAIQMLKKGQTWLQPAVSERIKNSAVNHLKQVNQDTWLSDPTSALTHNETQVLKLVAAGYSNQEIADALFKSEGTIRNQVSSVLAKLEARDRTRAVLKALDIGII